MATPSCDYELVLRQQPQQARVCSSDKLDRRPIDPPPIVQFCGVTPPTNASDPMSFLDNVNYFMFASLVSPDEDITMQYINDGKTRALNGPAISNLWHLEDLDEENAGFFVFPDLSIRLEGSFRLKLTLFEVRDANVHHCKSIFTDKFHVYTPNKFPGMQVSTELSCALADQGIKIRLRHDTRSRTKRTNNPTSSTKRTRDSTESGRQKNKRAKNDTVDNTPAPPSAWGAIDPSLVDPYMLYPPPPFAVPPQGHPHYPPQLDLSYPPSAHAFAPYPPPVQWDSSLQQYPPPPWYEPPPGPARTLEGGGDDKQVGGVKLDAPRRVLRARPGTVISTQPG